MKRENKSAKPATNLRELALKLTADEILDFNEMCLVRGGDGEGNGSEPIIIPPPPTGN